ncbi:GroES-like protein [Hypoxylon cercidicola]|nr:GroES-like protein [Hypoxylon cercidicola]
MSTVNRIFWQDKVGVPSVIREGPIPSKVADHELLIKVHAWAMNPVDAYLQVVALPFFRYPCIPGSDVSGTVELVGPAAASKFRVGDRVVGAAMSVSGHAKAEHGGFQDYVTLDSAMTCRIPDSLSFAEASVFPLCIATAAHALFARDFLGLPYPKAEAEAGGGEAAPAGKSVLVWGGASGVGSNAIQMARAAGFDVVATCSPRNFEYVLGLGAAKVLDYASPTVVADAVAELDGGGGACAGIFQAAGPFGAVAPCCQVAHRSRQDLFVACANAVPEGVVPEGVRARMVFGDDTAKPMYYDTTCAIFGRFLPEALASGEYKVAPKPEIVSSKGVDGIQEALDIVRKGVSARKIVVVDE